MIYGRGQNPNSLKNLRKWKRGQSGNPNGRPRNEACITHIQRKLLPQPCPYAEGKTWAEWLAKRGLELAGENLQVFRELMERLEGKVVFPIGAMSPPDKALPLAERMSRIRERSEQSNNK